MTGVVGMYKTNDLTKGEKIVLDFIQSHPGDTFTAYEIEEGTGIRADVVPWIMENLRWKGHKVNSKNGRHWTPAESWKGYVTLFILFGFIFVMFLMGILEALDRPI